jgi:uncharacterized protein (DUF302 family)
MIWCSSEALAVESPGLTTVLSKFGFSETMSRLVTLINDAGMSIFARIDHGSAARAIHLPLGPTELVIFGNAKGGTPLMQVSQAIGIDLPLKALVYQDASDKVWVAYNDPHWIVERHRLGAAVAGPVAVMAGMLQRIIVQATTRD